MNALSATESSDGSCTSTTCGGCGCVCDDIEVAVRGNRIVEARNACELGRTWFADGTVSDGPSCRVAGQAASLDEAIERAAQLLAAARRPLVYGLRQTSCEAVRLAAGIADWIGAVLDTGDGASGGLAGLSLAGVGEVTCSLGEIANRADLVLVWRANPRITHPRHFSRYSLAPRGRFVPGGRADRTCVVVDAGRTESAQEADLFLALPARCDFEALWILRALVRGVELCADDVLAQTGIALGAWQDLCSRLKQAKFAVILFDAHLGNGRAGHVQVDALWALVRDLNAHTRAAAAPLLVEGNAAGAASVVCARTGAPAAIDLARGYPRSNPGEYGAEEVLARREVDAVLMVAAGPTPNLSPAARRHLAATTRVTIGSSPTTGDDAAAVAFTTAACGRSAGGTLFRMDGVPLPLRPALVSPHPSDVEILARLERRVKQLCADRLRRVAASPA
ncbi:MAG TPA: formylmethanofuran dehydrogenase subunit B [Pirellulales bacterium]|nr:formylmethanofuran dehydrogenase subunit B [Pirellulales bacterium]